MEIDNNEFHRPFTPGAQVISELQDLVLQKERLMSSVTHELHAYTTGFIACVYNMHLLYWSHPNTVHPGAQVISELQDLVAQKERFMSSVSHELRTPLNGIIGLSDGLLNDGCGVLAAEVRRQVQIIRTSGLRLLALINDIMDAAALRHSQLVLKQEIVAVRFPSRLAFR